MACPRCGSNNITTNNKGYGIGKGVVGAALIGPLGLVAGNIGRHDIICTCLDCGHTWNLKKQIQHEKNLEYQKMQQEVSFKGSSLFYAWLFTPVVLFALWGGFHIGAIWVIITSLVLFPLVCPITSKLIEEKLPKELNVLPKILLVILIVLWICSIGAIDNEETPNTNTQLSSNVQTTQNNNKATVVQNTKQAFTGVLTPTQIDKICKNSLAEVNANSVSNYVKVSSNPSAKKYVYQSKETLYKYSCGFTGKDTFYINGEGWEDIIPRGTLYKGKTSNCVDFDLYDPGFKLTHNFTVCD